MSTLKQQDYAGWVAVQVSNFMDRLRHADGIQMSYYLDQIDNIPVCKGIIRQLILENRRLRKKGELK